MSDAAPVVAVVDDDAAFRKAIGGLMRMSGCRVEAYASGQEFLNCASLPNISLVLLDLQMGEISGLDLVRRLRTNGWATPVIFLTGRNDAKTLAAIEEQGALILVKPFDPDELVTMVRVATGVKLS